MRWMATALFVAAACEYAAGQQDRKADPIKEQIAAKLRTLRVTVDFKSAPIDDVVNYLREIADINRLFRDIALRATSRKSLLFTGAGTFEASA